MSTVTVKAEYNLKWKPDCQGRFDYDGRLVSLSCRYWPKRGEHNPSAYAEICLGDLAEGPYETLIKSDFVGETEQEVKTRVELWAKQMIERVESAIRKEFCVPNAELTGASGAVAAKRPVELSDGLCALVERLRNASHGYDEWRVQDPKDGSYCISFSCPETMHPERAAREWLDDHKARFPGGLHSDYVVVCVRVMPENDRLLLEAAATIEHLATEGSEP